MDNGKVVRLPLTGQILYASGSAAFTMLERLILLYLPFYYLPPREYNLPNLIPDQTRWGVLTVLGVALLFGRIFDGLADPVIASLSDNNRSRIGRRKLFLLLAGLPLALATISVFSPPVPDQQSLLNGFWLGSFLIIFYIAFTAYVNPYLALLSELGHSDALRINLATMIALFGLFGIILIAVLFPFVASWLQDNGLGFRSAYRYAITAFVFLALALLYLPALGFKEAVNCLQVKNESLGAWQSLRLTFGVKAFRIFLGGEMFLQFAMNTVTLGLIYYAVVLFQREERFMIILASLTIGGALLCFPAVNRLAKKKGKKKVIRSGVLALSLCGLAIFLLSYRIDGPFFYLILFMFFCAGFPLAVLTILINPTIADLARAEYYQTGRHHEAMFFGARAIPLKLTIALSGVVFAYLLSAFGRDIASPLGVQLSALVVGCAAAASFVFFSFYPEDKVRAILKDEEINKSNMLH